MLTSFIKYLFIIFNMCLLTTYANELSSKDHEEWLQQKYGAQHQKLIPIVAVADMFFACNNDRNNGEPALSLDELVNDMHKEELANRLVECLGEYSIQSERALNYGLKGCFEAQISYLSKEEKAQKMKIIEGAIEALSREERQKSFTQCVTDQSIKYLK